MVGGKSYYSSIKEYRDKGKESFCHFILDTDYYLYNNVLFQSTRSKGKVYFNFMDKYSPGIIKSGRGKYLICPDTWKDRILYRKSFYIDVKNNAIEKFENRKYDVFNMTYESTCFHDNEFSTKLKRNGIEYREQKHMTKEQKQSSLELISMIFLVKERNIRATIYEEKMYAEWLEAGSPGEFNDWPMSDEDIEFWDNHFSD